MSTEDRLRDAMSSRASNVEPHGDGWDRIEARLDQPPRTRALRFAGVATAAAVVLAVAVVAVTLRTNDTHTPVAAGPDTSTSTTDLDTLVDERPLAPTVLPPFSSPEDAARDFAARFLGMPKPTVGTYRAGDTTSGEIDISANATASLGSTLRVRSSSKGWIVVDAANDNLQLTSPATLEAISSPATITGKSVAFEGVVHVMLLPYGQTLSCVFGCAGPPPGPEVLANTTFTGGGTELTPFEMNIEFSRSVQPSPLMVLVLWTDSPRDGSLAEATVRLVRFAE